MKRPQLLNESKIMRLFNEEGLFNYHSLDGFAKIYWSGSQGQHNAMVMDLLGRTLEEQRIVCGGKLSPNTAIMLAIQLVLI